MPLWKIILEGQTAFDVQGVNLRESIERIAIDMKIEGYVRNKKGTKLVEIVCRGETERDAERLRDAINHRLFVINPLVKHDCIKIQGPQKHDDPAEREDEISGFEIKREDDLAEMVWALQNAGRALLIQSELRQKQQFRALGAEIDAFQGVLRMIIKDSNPYKQTFALIAIEGFLREPPSKCDANLIALLHQLYRYAKTINRMIQTKENKEEMPLEEVQNTLKDIENILRGAFK
jgi:acylphosphatase